MPSDMETLGVGLTQHSLWWVPVRTRVKAELR